MPKAEILVPEQEVIMAGWFPILQCKHPGRRYKTLPAAQADKTQVTTFWVVKPEQSRACQLENWFPVQNSSVVVPQLFLRQRRLPTQMYSKQLVPKQAELSHTQG